MESTRLFNPFPGLRPFEPDEDHLFFGREKEIDELLRRLRSTRFLQVAGTSGSGKSSLVRSGLIPALQSGFMVRAGSGWRVLIFRPGEDPIGHLAASLNSSDVLGTDGDLASTNQVLVEVTLRRGTLGLVDAVRQARIPSHDNILVVVDQFEELFRFRRSEHIENSRDEAVAFFKLLLEATRQDNVPIYVVLTMRADFIGDCMEFPGLPEIINEGLYVVPRMTRDELRSAITGPVAVGGGEITQRLVLRLLNDLGDNHDQLPLLQHALMRSWDHWVTHRQPGECMDVPDYEAIGTLQRALSLHAEEAYQETVAGHKEQITEKIFKALTDSFSDPRGVRRPTSLQDITAICEVSEQDAIEVIERFRCAGRSFLTPSGDVPLDPHSIIDLSHESLMRCWDRLVTWAEEERESASAYIRVALAASWCEECVGGLWTDPQLEMGLQWRRKNNPTAAWAERYDSNFTLAMDFLDRSEAQRGAEREKERKRRLTRQVVSYVLATLLVIVGALLYVVLKEKSQAESNLALAKKAVDESLSSAGRVPAREAADMPQMEEFRKELLDKARTFYLAFAKQYPNSENLLYEAALAHSKLGDIERLVENHESAIADYKQAITQLYNIVQQHPRNLEYRRSLAYSHNWLGETMRVSLKRATGPLPYTHADAEQEYNMALSLQKELHDQNLQNDDYQQELARTYYNRGILQYDNQQSDKAETDFREAIQLLEPLTAVSAPSSTSEPQNPPPALELSRVCNNLGTLLRKEGKLEEAAKFYERAIGIHRELVKKDPSNREYKQELASFYQNLALLELDENQLALAEEQNHEALDLIEELASPGPSLTMKRAEAHMVRGSILESQSKQLPQAQSETEESQRILETQKRINAREHPEFHNMYMTFAVNYANLTAKYLQSGELVNAQHALDSLARVMPELSQEDRAKFAGQFHELQKQLRDAKAKQIRR
jgi:tetratricopeptide (TPR) repeat protein